MTTSEAFKALYDTVAKLRGPDGCKWDREQTPSSLRSALIEETYECLEAIDENDTAHIAEELGDLFLLATMISFMHEEEGKFSVAEVLLKVNEKLIRRHPHVFAEVKVKDTEEILDNWAAIKAAEKGRKSGESMLDDVSLGFPPMDRSFALQKKAAKVGFDWPDCEGVIAKIREEIREVEEACTKRISHGDARDTEAQSIETREKKKEQEVEEELGDLLFSVINLCRFLKVNPSAALRRTNSKFVERFKYMEKKMKETGQKINKENLEVMDTFWNEAKSIS